MGKKAALFFHAKKRIKERFGIFLSRKLHREIVNLCLIERGFKKEFIQSNRVRAFEIEIKKKKMIVYIDIIRKSLITVSHTSTFFKRHEFDDNGYYDKHYSWESMATKKDL